MSFSTEANAGFRITGFTHNATALLARIRCLLEKLVIREAIRADANNTPVSRPVDELDARVSLDFLDNSGAISHTAASANITENYSEAGGSSGSIIMGPMVAGSVTHNHGRKMGGFGVQQVFELEGTSLTYTPTA